MKTIFKILFAPLLWVFSSCSPLGDPVDPINSDSHYYNNSKSDIQYSPMGNWFEIQNTSMNADVESFEVLNRDISRDKNRIYFEAYPVTKQSIDLSSVYVKNEDFMSTTVFDKNNVYALSKEFVDDDSFSYNGIATRIENANPLTFKRIDYDWAQDGSYHFYRNNSIAADYDSFEILNDNFAKDSTQIFVRTNDKFIVADGDINTFRALENSQNAIDNTKVYWISFAQDGGANQLTVIPFTDIKKVNYLNSFFIKVEDTVYFNGKAMPDADAKTFAAISYRYGKDSKHVYYENKIIPNADSKSFEVSKKYGVRDKNGIYREGKLKE